MAADTVRAADDEYPGFLPKSWRWLVSPWLSSFVVAVFTGALTWLGLEQRKLSLKLAAETKDALAVARQSAEAATRTADTMQDTARRQLRAYVSRTRAVLDAVGGEGVVATITLKNAGQTPAYSMTGWIGIRIERPDDRPRNGGPPGPPASVATIGPGSEQLLHCTLAGPIAQNVYDDLIAGRRTLRVEGGVDYVDAFGEPHRTTFNFVMNPGLAGKPFPWWMTACLDDNEET